MNPGGQSENSELTSHKNLQQDFYTKSNPKIEKIKEQKEKLEWQEHPSN